MNAPNADAADAGARPEMAPTPGAGGGVVRGAAVWAAAFGVALASWLLCESGLLQIQPGNSRYNMMGTDITGPTQETRRVAIAQTAALVYGAFGGLLGLGLGLAGGVTAGRTGSVKLAAAIGAAGGFAAGALAALAVLPPYLNWAGDSLGDPLPSLAMHCGLWVPLGAVVGLALGVGRCGFRRAAVFALGGALGAVVGTAIYEILGAVAFPLSETSDPVAGTWPARLLTFLLLAPAMALGATTAGRFLVTAVKDAGRRPPENQPAG